MMQKFCKGEGGKFGNGKKRGGGGGGGGGGECISWGPTVATVETSYASV